MRSDGSPVLTGGVLGAAGSDEKRDTEIPLRLERAADWKSAVNQYGLARKTSCYCAWSNGCAFASSLT